MGLTNEVFVGDIQVGVEDGNLPSKPNLELAEGIHSDGAIQRLGDLYLESSQKEGV